MKQLDFNASFIARMIPKIDWAVLKTAAETVSEKCQTPHKVPLPLKNESTII